MFLKKFIASTCQSLTRKLFSTPRACRKPDVGVVRTTTNRRPSLLSCFELMSSNLPNNKANQPITLTQSCLKANLPSHCALTHSGHKYKPNKPSHCTRWPLRQMTRCGLKANKPSHSARWPFLVYLFQFFKILSRLTCFFTFSLATNQSHATIQVTIHVTIKIFLLNYGMTSKHQNF